MRQFIVGYIQNNTKWYLSTINPPKGKFYGGVLGIDLSTKFGTKAMAEQAIRTHIIGKQVKGIFVCEYNYTAINEVA